MAQDILVKDLIVDGYKVIEQLRLEHFDVTAAAWIQEEDRPWYLFIASKKRDEDGPKAYGKLHEIFDRMPELYIEKFGVKLIGTDHKYAKAIVEFYQRHPTLVYGKLRLPVLGGGRIPEAHVYPPAANVPAASTTS